MRSSSCLLHVSPKDTRRSVASFEKVPPSRSSILQAAYTQPNVVPLHLDPSPSLFQETKTAPSITDTITSQAPSANQENNRGFVSSLKPKPKTQHTKRREGPYGGIRQLIVSGWRSCSGGLALATPHQA